MKTWRLQPKWQSTLNWVAMGVLVTWVFTVTVWALVETVRGEGMDGAFGLLFFWGVIGMGTWMTLTMPHMVTVSDGGTVTFVCPLGERTVHATEIAAIHWSKIGGPAIQRRSSGAVPGSVQAMVQLTDGLGRIKTPAKYDALVGFVAGISEHNPEVELSTASGGLFGLGERDVTVQELWEQAPSDWMRHGGYGQG